MPGLMKAFPPWGMGWLAVADEIVMVMSECGYELIRVAPAAKADQVAAKPDLCTRKRNAEAW